MSLESRGDRREDIFLDDVDRQDFLKTLAEACLKTGFQVHAYCLMRNHFHLVVETPQGNLVAGMRWLLSADTLRLNHRHKLFGHVFSGRYKALIVDTNHPGYLKSVCDYVHLNPVRAKLLGAEDRLLGHPWSSLGWYLATPEQRPKSDPGKLALAARLRRETTLPLRWIAARLHLGTWKSASSRLHAWKKTDDKHPKQWTHANAIV